MSSLNPVITSIVTGVLSGGGISGLTALYQARRRAPFEENSLAVQASNTALTSLTKAIEETERRLATATAELKDAEQRYGATVETTRRILAKLEDVHVVLMVLRTECTHVERVIRMVGSVREIGREWEESLLP